MASTQASHDELLITAGKLVSNASLNETFMLNAFKILCGCPIKTARAIFYASDSFPAKKNLLNRVVDVTGDDEDRAIVKKIIDAVEKSNNQRQEIAHALIMTDKPTIESSSKIILRQPKSLTAKSQPVTTDYLKTILGHSFDACRDGQKAFEQLCQKHGVPLRPQI